MQSFVALLRGINMGGHKKLAMNDLRSLAERIGCSRPQTLRQSGNLLFAATATPAALENALETALLRDLGLQTTVLIRRATAWRKLVAANPYSRQAVREPQHLALMLLKHKPSPASVATLKKAITGPEVFAVYGRTLYAWYPDGFAETKFTIALIDRTLGTIATARSWSTVLKITAAAGLEQRRF